MISLASACSALARLFCLTVIMTSAVRAQSPTTPVPDGLAGRWAGASIESGTPTLFELTFRLDDDSLQTDLTLPYNGYDHFPYAFTYAPGGAYDGTLTSGLFGDRMDLVVDLGEWHLRGTVTTDDSVTARVHLQKVADFPSPPIRTEAVAFRAGADTLAGSLFLPNGPGPHPAAVLVAGRGATTRGGTALWGRLLARSGVVALAFDERGFGGSTGDTETTAADRFNDVNGALDALHARSDLGAVGLFSYSAGGWIIPTVAAQRDDVAFVVTFVGPAVSLADQQGHVTAAFMRASGDAFSDDEYAEAFAYQLRTVTLAQERAPWSDFEAINAPARAARWAEHALIPDSLDATDLVYFRLHPYDAPTWPARTPVLAVFGERDLIVPPTENVPVLRRTFAEHPDATILVVPGADHTLARPTAIVGKGTWPDRFYRPWTRSPLVLTTLIEWLQTRFVIPPSP